MMVEGKPASPIRETNAEAVRLAKTLIREARFGALAVLEPETGHPFSSRVALATAADGAPVILVSRLSGHTAGILGDSRCSILLGDPGKGDPLAHPRITIQSKAVFLRRGEPDCDQAAERYLRRNPKAKLYAGFGDFNFVRLEPEWASLNGGFGQAYRLNREELLDAVGPAISIASIESSAIEHMQNDHPDFLKEIIAAHCGKISATWRLTGIDSTGLDIINGDKPLRIWFGQIVMRPEELQAAIRSLRKK